MVVADLGADAVRRLVPRAGVIHAHPGGIRQAGAEHVTGFFDEAVLISDQQTHNLAL